MIDCIVGSRRKGCLETSKYFHTDWRVKIIYLLKDIVFIYIFSFFYAKNKKINVENQWVRHLESLEHFKSVSMIFLERYGKLWLF